MITFEGTDGCGKSTQMEMLAGWLGERGYEVTATREPGGCPIAERIREVILSLDSSGMSAECEALLYAAARIEHVRSVVLPALRLGKIVLCDRFLDSRDVYKRQPFRRPTDWSRRASWTRRRSRRSTAERR